jgi:hypothetical protein
LAQGAQFRYDAAVLRPVQRLIAALDSHGHRNCSRRTPPGR